MRNLIIGFFLGVFIFLGFSMARIDRTKQSAVLSSNRIDTLSVSDSIFQVVKYTEKGISSIKYMNKKKQQSSDVSAQEIVFHDNGVIKSINMYNGTKLMEVDGVKQYVYQNNFISFSSNGILEKSQFMKDFQIISKYN